MVGAQMIAKFHSNVFLNIKERVDNTHVTLCYECWKKEISVHMPED